MKQAVAKVTRLQFRQKRPPEPPKGLKKAGKELWNAIQTEYFVDDPGGIAHLTSACRAEDDIARMRAQVAAAGDTVADRFGQIREHPLLAAIRGLEGVKRQALKALNLDIEPLKERPGRPAGS